MLKNFKFGDSPPSVEMLRKGRLKAIAIIAALSTIGIGMFHTVNQSHSSESKQKQENLAPEPIIKTVTALGRLIPKGDVVKLTAPSTIEGSRVEKLLVKQGDKVKAGQVIAILDSHDKQKASLEEAKGSLQAAKANLAKVKEGVKKGEINAQKATVARLQAERDTQIAAQKATVARLKAEHKTQILAQKAAVDRVKAQLKNDKKEYERNQKLYEQGAISASSRDSKQLAWETAQQQINEAQANLLQIRASKEQEINEAQANLLRIQTSKEQEIKEGEANLNRILEVRPVDVVAAQAEVKQALAAVKKAEADLKLSFVLSPQEGQVFKVYTRPGEVPSSSDGVVDIGQTNQMYAMVEVYQSDIRKVRPGQEVLISSDSISGKLQGTVEKVGWQVQRQDVINSDPSSNIDARVVEVEVKLDEASSEKAAKLTNLQIQAAIQL